MKHRTVLINKEISWLKFNERVLQEAFDSKVPIINRLKFLGIFSSNLDEFFRVRVATLMKLSKIYGKDNKVLDDDPKTILKKIQKILFEQNKKFEEAYRIILEELKNHNIYILNEKEITEDDKKYIKNIFHSRVHSRLFPIILNHAKNIPNLKDKAIYLAVKLFSKNNKIKTRYALLEVPSNIISRFIVLPKNDEKINIILLDDVIRSNFSDIFSMFDYDLFEAYTVKLTRNAELDIDNDLSESLIKKMSRSLKKRNIGVPVRFVYDAEMPVDLLTFLKKKLKLTSDDLLMPGSRYHNFKDFIDFPSFNNEELVYNVLEPLKHKDLVGQKSILSVIKNKDILLYVPYTTFDSFIDLLREASMDPAVESIKITIYRAAKNSSVLNALINAVRNGKKVTVVIELQARFDEESNINWANKLRDEGVTVTYGIHGLKVHSKLCLITRVEKKSKTYYAVLGTGNFNEDTAKVYTDLFLFTSDTRITKDVVKIFDFFESSYKVKDFYHLIVSPFNTRERFSKLIHNEIINAKDGKPASIMIKVNNLTDPKIINKLYRASILGVKIKIIARSMFSLVPQKFGLSENIEVVSIVDRFLEHARVFIFHNNGDEKVYIASLDCMERNFDKRVEVMSPVYDTELKGTIKNILDIQFSDNLKARVIDEKMSNEFKTNSGGKIIHSQLEIYDYMKKIHNLDLLN